MVESTEGAENRLLPEEAHLSGIPRPRPLQGGEDQSLGVPVGKLRVNLQERAFTICENEAATIPRKRVGSCESEEPAEVS